MIIFRYVGSFWTAVETLQDRFPAFTLFFFKQFSHISVVGGPTYPLSSAPLLSDVYWRIRNSGPRHVADFIPTLGQLCTSHQRKRFRDRRRTQHVIFRSLVFLLIASLNYGALQHNNIPPVSLNCTMPS